MHVETLCRRNDRHGMVLFPGCVTHNRSLFCDLAGLAEMNGPHYHRLNKLSISMTLRSMLTGRSSLHEYAIQAVFSKPLRAAVVHSNSIRSRPHPYMGSEISGEMCKRRHAEVVARWSSFLRMMSTILSGLSRSTPTLCYRPHGLSISASPASHQRGSSQGL